MKDYCLDFIYDHLTCEEVLAVLFPDYTSNQALSKYARLDGKGRKAVMDSNAEKLMELAIKAHQEKKQLEKPIEEMPLPNTFIQTDDEKVGPFDSEEDAEQYIYNCYHHGYDVSNWYII